MLYKNERKNAQIFGAIRVESGEILDTNTIPKSLLNGAKARIARAVELKDLTEVKSEAKKPKEA